jgi:uncharacterized membrane protein YhaH (DUF805 family)
MQTTYVAAGPRLEIGTSHRRIITAMLPFILMTLLGLATFAVPDRNLKLIISLWVLLLFFVPATLMIGYYAFRVVLSGKAALTFERDGLRLNYAGGFIPYRQIEKVTLAGSPVLHSVGLRLRPGTEIPKLNFGMKFPGRNIPLLGFFAMPAERIAEELERRVAGVIGTQRLTEDGTPAPSAPLVTNQTLWKQRLNRPSYFAALAGLVLLQVLMRKLEMANSTIWLFAAWILALRQHDLGKNGYWAFALILIPFIALMPKMLGGTIAFMALATLIIAGFRKGMPDANAFGPPLKGLFGRMPFGPRDDGRGPPPSSRSTPHVPAQPGRAPIVEEMQRRDGGFSIRSSQPSSFGTRNLLAAPPTPRAQPVYSKDTGQSRAGLACLIAALVGAALFVLIVYLSLSTTSATITDGRKVAIGLTAIIDVFVLLAALGLGVMALLRGKRRYAITGLAITVVPLLLAGLVAWFSRDM